MSVVVDFPSACGSSDACRLRRRQRLMSQQLLNAPQVGAIVQHVSGEACVAACGADRRSRPAILRYLSILRRTLRVLKRCPLLVYNSTFESKLPLLWIACS